MSRASRLIKVAGFLALCLAILALLSRLFVPIAQPNNRLATVGLYEMERNTVEVAFLGTSTALSGISPDELYDLYGISAYNSACGSQPTFSSYYLLEEYLRLQGESLKVVVFDPSRLVLDKTPKNRTRFTIERIIKDMEFSPVKLRCIIDAAQTYSDPWFYGVLVPAIKYHSRWSKLTEDDHDYFFHGYEGQDTTARGQYIRYLGLKSVKKPIETPSEENKTITASKDFEDEYLEKQWPEFEFEYVERIVDLCKEKNIDLVFIQTPRSGWADEMHDSIQMLADRYGIPFIDYCTPEMLETTGIEYEIDLVDHRHPNIHGARKLSEHLGEFLMQNYDLHDYRNDPNNARFESDAISYAESIEDSQLLVCNNFSDYLGLLDNERFTVFLATKGDAATALSDEDRAKLVAMGFAGLSDFQNGQLYIGITQGCSFVAEQTAETETYGQAQIIGSFKDGAIKVLPKGAIVNKKDEDAFSLTSQMGSASMWIGGEGRSPNKNGLNFVVYDTLRNEIIDISNFDTSSDCARHWRYC